MTGEKKRPHERTHKRFFDTEMIVSTYYDPDTQVDFDHAIPTAQLLGLWYKNYNAGTHTIEPKSKHIKELLSLVGLSADKDYYDYLMTVEPPIANNYEYTFKDADYNAVHFSIWRDGRHFGFCRDDTGEIGEFTATMQGDVPKISYLQHKASYYDT